MGNPPSEPFRDQIVKKSNALILAKYKSTQLENTIMSIALSRIEARKIDGRTKLEANLYPGELKYLISDPSHIYRDLKNLAKSIVGNTMIIEDGKGNFSAFSMVPNADFKDGVLKITFNDEIRSHIEGLGSEKGFTSLAIAITSTFESNASTRLYEVLKKEAYRIPHNGCAKIEYDLYELKFMIGIANSECEKAKNYIKRNKVLNWEEMYSILDKKDKQYDEWGDFKRYVLDKAKKELKEKSDIRFEYVGIREKRKTSRVLFTIYKNSSKAKEEKIKQRKEYIEKNMAPSDYTQMTLDFEDDDVVDMTIFSDFVGHNELTPQNIETFLDKAGGDEEKVRKAIALADKQDNIKNYVGWIISAITNNYTETQTMNGSAEMAKFMNRLEERIHDNSLVDESWERMKTKPDFDQFIESTGLKLDQLECAFDKLELIERYTRWSSRQKKD